MEISEISQSLSSVVYQKILVYIINGEYPANEKLPSEAKLCVKYRVSRPILREALARLKEDNLIVTRRGSGSFVIRQPDDAVLSFSKISSISDIQRCFEFRTDFEGCAAAHASIRRTAEQLDHIKIALNKMNQENIRNSVATDEDFKFHTSIVEASNNPYYTTVMKSLQENIKEGMNLTRKLSLQSSHDRVSLVQDEHKIILKHIIAGDAKKTEIAMKTHLNNARIRMFEGTD